MTGVMEDAQELLRPASVVFARTKSPYAHAPGSDGEPTAIKVRPSSRRMIAYCSLFYSGDTFG